MKYILISLVLVLSTALSGCSSTTEKETPRYTKENDPRVGDSVSQVCFNSGISGWSEVDNDRNALLVHFGVNRIYKVQLIGMCEADWAMSRIAVISRTNSSCMSRGDKVLTDAQNHATSSCSITKIYEWHDIAEKEKNQEKDK